MTYEDEAFDELEKKLQKQVAHGVTDGSKKDAALKLALEALETSMYPQQKQLQAIITLKEALEDV